MSSGLEQMLIYIEIISQYFHPRKNSDEGLVCKSVLQNNETPIVAVGSVHLSLCAVLQWSYGVLLWEVFTRGSTPYEHVENWDIGRYIQKGNRLERPEYCPSKV